MKTITIAGRTGKPAELRRTQSGDPVLSFSVAVDDGYGQNKKTMWFDCSVWGKRAEALQNHIPKGTALTVSGDLSTREHNEKTYLAVRVNELTLQGGGGQRQQTEQSGYVEEGQNVDLDDSIPFAPSWK